MGCKKESGVGGSDNWKQIIKKDSVSWSSGAWRGQAGETVINCTPTLCGHWICTPSSKPPWDMAVLILILQTRQPRLREMKLQAQWHSWAGMPRQEVPTHSVTHALHHCTLLATSAMSPFHRGGGWVLVMYSHTSKSMASWRLAVIPPETLPRLCSVWLHSVCHLPC